MERYYDGDQEALFKAAHVINPYVKPKKEPKVKKSAIDLPTDYISLFSIVYIFRLFAAQ